MHSPLPLNHKIRHVMIMISMSMLLLIMRLFYLQIHQMKTFVLLGEKNYTRIEKIASTRGNILDVHGQLLATNRPVTDLYWQGTNNLTLTPHHHTTIAALQTILGDHLLITVDQVSLRRTEKQGTQLLLARDLTLEQLSKIAELSHCPNLTLTTRFKRHYPHGSLASHLVGYLGHLYDDPIGKMGLEKVLEENLKGKEGEVLKIINSLGKKLTEKELKQPLSGEDIRTTIDLNIQRLAEQLFPPDYAGSFIIMDPKNGALRALVSRPDFDPTIFLSPLDPVQWHTLQEKKAFLNRAFNACYPPASIFKLVSTSAGLEKGIIDQDTMIHCKGFYTFGDHNHWCHQHNGHGTLSVQKALALSCNILFFHIGKHVAIDTLANYAHRFGLGQKTNIIFPEHEGVVPTSHWKLITKKERWWPGETLSAAIGQSFLLVTPIQIARMIASIFEGYLVTPRLLEQEKIEKRPLLISRTTLEFLRQSMRSVVSIGTGVSVSHIRDIEVHAKTGTAQTSSLALRNLDDKYLEHAWFVAHFRYKNHDPLILVILIEHVGSSRVATAVAKSFLLEYRNLMEQQAY
jgi:penicillin-binding protein 2